MARVLNLESVHIGFRNLEGREGPYNQKGDRSFVVFLDKATADELAAEGWNVKFPNPLDSHEDDEFTRDPYLSVSVSTRNFPSNVVMISNGVPTRLQPDELGLLDWAELENVDLVIRPYEWEVNRQKGIKAYLKSGYFTIVTDAFAAKYGL